MLLSRPPNELLRGVSRLLQEADFGEVFESPEANASRETGEPLSRGKVVEFPSGHTHEAQTGVGDGGVGGDFRKFEHLLGDFFRLEENHEPFEEHSKLLRESRRGFRTWNVENLTGVPVSLNRGAGERDEGGFFRKDIADSEGKTEVFREFQGREGLHCLAEVLFHLVGFFGVPERAFRDVKRVERRHFPVEEAFSKSRLGGDFPFEVRSGAGDHADGASPLDFDAGSEALTPRTIVDSPKLTEDFPSNVRMLAKDRGKVRDQ